MGESLKKWASAMSKATKQVQYLLGFGDETTRNNHLTELSMLKASEGCSLGYSRALDP